MSALQDVIGRLKNVKKTINGYMAQCPIHEDDKQSLSVTEVQGKILMKCFAGCDTEQIVKSLGITMKDLFTATAVNSPKIFTIDDFSIDKKIPADFLTKNGLSNIDGGVEICYRDANGKRALRQRLRKDNVAGSGSLWLGEKGVSPVPYGLWKLQYFARTYNYLLLTEGESDALTAWYHGLSALGIPGADMAKILEIEHISYFKKLYILEEPDKGGKTFVKGINSRVRTLGFKGEVCVIKMPDNIKDLNDLHRRNNDEFIYFFNKCIDDAKVVPVPVVKEIKAPVEVRGFNLTDYGNAQRLIGHFGTDLRYCYQWNRWIIWNDVRWHVDSTGEIYRRAKLTVRRIYNEAAAEDSDEVRKALWTHARKSESSSRIADMIKLAQSEPGVPVTPDELDRNQYLFNVKNGTIDLRTGILREHRREDMITKLSNVVFKSDAKCPMWLKFMLQIMDRDKDLVRFIQRTIGYGMTGDVSEQVLFFLYGTGANGKSVLLELILALLGDYAKTSEPELLMAKRGEAHPTGVADLHGIRFISSIEVGDGKRMNETLVKQLTGSDRVKARYMRQDFFEFIPTHKIFLAANHKPAIRGTDYAIWRRIRLIPFNVKFSRPNKHMAEDLKSEMAGILNWAIAGCLEWLENGLREPLKVMKAVAEYRNEMDVIGTFISDHCVVVEFAKGSSSALYGKYQEWCKETGEYQVSQRKFGLCLTERGFVRERGIGGQHWWVGVGLCTLDTHVP